MNLLYFGSDALALRALNILTNMNSIIRNVSVVTPPDRIAGRGHKNIVSCATKIGAKSLGLKVIDAPLIAPKPPLEEWKRIIDFAKDEQADVAVVFSFGEYC